MDGAEPGGMDRGTDGQRAHLAQSPTRSSGQPCTAEGAERPPRASGSPCPKIPALKTPLRSALGTQGGASTSCPAFPLSLDKNSAGNPQDVTKQHLQTFQEPVSCPTECWRPGQQLPLHTQIFNPIYCILLCNMNTALIQLRIFQYSHTMRGEELRVPQAHPTLHTWRGFYLQNFQTLSTILPISWKKSLKASFSHWHSLEAAPQGCHAGDILCWDLIHEKTLDQRIQQLWEMSKARLDGIWNNLR